jgi:hypothetical protein
MTISNSNISTTYFERKWSDYATGKQFYQPTMAKLFIRAISRPFLLEI